jgi:DedD protein
VERAVKERLVGAAVLMAAAIVLIPEMLSGPDREPSAPARTSAGEAPIKTYTIDLNQAPGAPPVATSAGAEDTLAPPPEEIAPAPDTTAVQAPPAHQGMPESAPVPTPTTPNDAVAATAKPTTPAPPAAAAPRERPADRSPPLATTPAAPKSGAWAVQLGSFSKQATAERLAKEWSGQGLQAFVMPVKSGSSTLYRVRIGPMQDRASAEAALRKVKPTLPGAAVVPHP